MYANIWTSFLSFDVLSKNVKLVISIVTFNNEKTICKSIDSILESNGFTNGELKIFIFDNASADKTVSLLEQNYRENFDNKQIILSKNTKNIGFSAAHNVNIQNAFKSNFWFEHESAHQFVFVANPDLVVEKFCLDKLVKYKKIDNSCGLLGPIIFRAKDDLEDLKDEILDSAGMMMTKELRHLDIGSNQNVSSLDLPTSPYQVFGITGAAVLFSKSFYQNIVDSDPNAEFFDEDFFAYREDADLSWRSKILGYSNVVFPEAKAYHVRSVLPDNRKAVSAKINSMSVRNRFFLQIKNFRPIENISCIAKTFFRNFLVICACFVNEWSSIKGIFEVFSKLGFFMKKRKTLFSHKKYLSSEINSFFSNRPILKKQTLLKFDSVKNFTSYKLSEINELDIVIVDYRSGKRIINCLETICNSVKNLKNVKSKVFVVDNDSSSFAKAGNYKDLLNIEVLDPQRNLGFAGAINRYLGLSKQTSDKAVLILNPDIELLDSSLNDLVCSLNKFPFTDGVVPLLCDRELRPQLKFSLKRLPSLIFLLFEILSINKIFSQNKISKEVYYYELLNEELISEFKVEQPPAACWLLRSTILKKLNGFDESFYPAWFEDVDFAKRLNDSGGSFILDPKIKVIHEGGYSTKVITKFSFYQIWAKNLLLYIKKHHGILSFLVFLPIVYLTYSTKLIFYKFLPSRE